MFRSTTHSGCHGIFQRGRQASKDETAFRKFSISSNNSTVSTVSSGGQSRNTSISSATTISSRGSNGSIGYNPLCLHPPMSVNKPPKIDDDAEYLSDLILEVDEEEEQDDEMDDYFGSTKYHKFHDHKDNNDQDQHQHQHDDQANEKTSTAVTSPFGSHEYDRFRFPAPDEKKMGARRASLDGEDNMPPCPDVDWELEQHIPVDGEGWHKRKRSFKRKAMLFRPETVHTMGAYM